MVKFVSGWAGWKFWVKLWSTVRQCQIQKEAQLAPPKQNNYGLGVVQVSVVLTSCTLVIQAILDNIP